MNAQKRKNPGFTLVELMVALVVVAVLSGIAVPAIYSYRATANLNSASRDLFSNLQLGRMAAIKRSANLLFVFNPSAYTPGGKAGSYLAFYDANGDWAQDAGEEVFLTSQTMPDFVTLYSTNLTTNGTGGSSESAASAMVGFDNHGLAARASDGSFVFGSISIRNSQGSYIRVTVSPAGNIIFQTSKDGSTWSS